MLIENEVQQSGEALAIDPVAIFYVNRLDNLLQARHQLDHSTFNISYWGEMPIYPTDEMKGLKYGMDVSIVSTYSMLKSIGLESAAQIMIDLAMREEPTK